MKNLLFLLSLFTLCLISPNASSQINILEAIQQNAEEGAYGEEHTAENQENVPEPTEEQREFMENLKKFLEEEKKNLDAFNEWDSQMKCIYMMSAYVYHLEILNQETEDISACKLKYDMYGMQLLAIASSTTIMYCPEGMANAGDEEIGELSRELYKLYMTDIDTFGPETRPVIKNLKTWIHELLYGPFRTLYNENGDNPFGSFISFLIAHFHPEFVLGKSLEIGQKMEALGCGG
jgi:hypothetical protein|tara:strand:- start:138301 stop:139005 length:705 start_codon:yes stop_codon:yes gene_type:complete